MFPFGLFQVSFSPWCFQVSSSTCLFGPTLPSARIAMIETPGTCKNKQKGLVVDVFLWNKTCVMEYGMRGDASKCINILWRSVQIKESELQLLLYIYVYVYIQRL